MCNPEIYKLQLTTEELIFIEQALLGLVQVRQHSDILSSLLDRVYSFHPHPVVTPPTPSSSIHTGVSLSPPPTTPSIGARASALSAFPTPVSDTMPSPLPFVGDGTLPDQAQNTEDADGFEL